MSIRADGTVVVPLRSRGALRVSYGLYLAPSHPAIVDSVLVTTDFSGERTYVQKIVEEINASRQFATYDGCAVMMRRLMEVLIIEAYERHGRGAAIQADGSYLSLSGLVGAITSGADFKLSRSGPRSMELCKVLGDNAAHSRSYITKKIDIDDFSAAFRRLIDELRDLVPRR